MRVRARTTWVAVVAAATITAAGCGDSSENDSAATTTSVAATDGDHTVVLVDDGEAADEGADLVCAAAIRAYGAIFQSDNATYDEEMEFLARLDAAPPDPGFMLTPDDMLSWFAAEPYNCDPDAMEAAIPNYDVIDADDVESAKPPAASAPTTEPADYDWRALGVPATADGLICPALAEVEATVRLGLDELEEQAWDGTSTVCTYTASDLIGFVVLAYEPRAGGVDPYRTHPDWAVTDMGGGVVQARSGGDELLGPMCTLFDDEYVTTSVNVPHGSDACAAASALRSMWRAG